MGSVIWWRISDPPVGKLFGLECFKTDSSIKTLPDLIHQKVVTNEIKCKNLSQCPTGRPILNDYYDLGVTQVCFPFTE